MSSISGHKDAIKNEQPLLRRGRNTSFKQRKGLHHSWQIDDLCSMNLKTNPNILFQTHPLFQPIGHHPSRPLTSTLLLFISPRIFYILPFLSIQIDQFPPGLQTLAMARFAGHVRRLQRTADHSLPST